mgnify:CR=1 FL=1
MNKSITDIVHGPVFLGNNRVAFDLDQYRSLNDSDQHDYLQELIRIIENDFDLPGEQIQALTDFAQRSVSAPEGVLDNYGGAAVMYFTDNNEGRDGVFLSTKDPSEATVGIALFESNSIEPENFFASALGYENSQEVRRELNLNFSDLQEEIFYEFVLEHEAGHLINGLAEPGADMIAAARLLQKHPDDLEVRETLLRVADLRGVQSMFFPNAAAANVYGIANQEGLMQILTMSPNELARLDDAELIELAQQQDERADDMRYWNNVDTPDYIEPALTVKASLQNRLKSELGLDLDSNDLTMKTVLDEISIYELGEVVQDLMNDGTYSPNSAEWQILESLDDSLERLSEKMQPGQVPNLDYQPVPGYAATQ